MRGEAGEGDLKSAENGATESAICTGERSSAVLQDHAISSTAFAASKGPGIWSSGRDSLGWRKQSETVTHPISHWPYRHKRYCIPTALL